MMEFLIELIADILSGLIPTPKSKIEKAIERLKKVKWFRDLLKDYRYEYIILNNKKVKKLLRNKQGVEQLLNDAAKQEEFIALVKCEHEKFVKLG